MILALRALGLGDLLTAVPALRALRRGGALALAVPRPLHPLVAWAGLADQPVAVESAIDEPPRPLAWNGQPPSLAVNLHGKGPQSTDVLRRLRPAQLWSYGIDGAPDWDPDEHEVARWCRLVAHYGCAVDPTDLLLRPSEPAGNRDGVIVHPGAASPERRWPTDRFAAVAGALAADGHRVMVTAGPGEEGMAAAVVQGAGNPTITVAAGMDLLELARCVLGSALVVSNDTGVAHLATGLRTPSVVLFGPQPPYRWGPPPSSRHAVLWQPTGEPGEPGRPDPALLGIGVADVLAAATSILANA